MDILLTAEEARVLGSLIEKSLTTPDQYPLSLNALTSACNQKSNREPLMELYERTVQQTLDALARKHLVLEKSGFGSRVPKYQQRFCNTGFGSLSFTPQETAVLCELLLRGPQTPGELRTRAGRMCEMKDLAATEQALDNLAKRSDGPFVVQLPREPGRREARYAHLLSGEVSVPEGTMEAAGPAEPRAASHAERIERLEAAIAELRGEIEELKQR